MYSQVLSAQNSSLAPRRHKGNVTFWAGSMRPSTSLITPSQNVPQTPQVIPTSHLVLLPLPCPRCPLCTFPTFFQFFSSMNSSAQKSFLTPAMLPLSCPPNSNITTYYKWCLHFSSSRLDFIFVCCFVYMCVYFFQLLQDLAHSRNSVNIYYINEWI